MDTINPSDFANWCSGTWQGGVPARIDGVSNDTRTLGPGQLFAALKTAARDGHDFLPAALEAVASGAIVERYQSNVALPQLVVENVGEALLAAAHGYRLKWQGEVVGVTGSCGKTTCKELLRSLLSRRKPLCTEGNLNNLIGVPLSMLRPEAAKAEFSVFEAGISEPGEMERLAHAINPDWAIISSLGPAHLRDLGSVNTIAREKAWLAKGKRVQGVFLGESCKPYLESLDLKKAQLVKMDPHLSTEWAYRFESRDGRTTLEQRIGGSVQKFEYEGMGAGLASNAAICIGLAFTLGLEVDELREGLATWRPSRMRNEWRQLGERRVFLDCYNANPLSMRDSLATFVAHTPETESRVFLIGCMEELGEQASSLHRELGAKLPFRNEDFLLVIGGEAKSVLQGMKDAGRDTDRCKEVTTPSEMTECLAKLEGNLFLKGSRRYRLEEVFEELSKKEAGAC